MKNRSTIETMQRLASQMDGLALASRGMRAIRPAKKIVSMPKKVRKIEILEAPVLEKISAYVEEADYASDAETKISECVVDFIGSLEEEMKELEQFNEEQEVHEEIEEEIEVVSVESVPVIEEVITEEEVKEEKPVKKEKETTSGYGSETSGDSDQLIKAALAKKAAEEQSTGHDHCVRCHKTFDANSTSPAEMRCVLPHPTKNVVPIRRDDFGTDFVCLCCRTEFRLPKMAFYEAGVNSMLTGHCFVGQHTLDKNEIDYQQGGGAALSCEEAGCIEYFV